MRSRIALGLGGGLLLMAGVGALVLSDGADDDGATATSTATATTAIVREDLREFETVQGRIGYADARPAFAQRGGTVTWLPRVGGRVRPGQRLFQADGRSVFLFDGAQPAYRALGPGMRGTDVRQVERTLRATGDAAGTSMRTDGVWDAGTTAALQHWQERVGRPTTGRLELGDVHFAPGDRQVAAVDVRLGGVVGGGAAAGGGQATGAGAATQVLTTTSTRPIVSLDVDASQQDLAVAGASVRVTLPDDRVVPGTVVRRARAAGQGAAAAQGAAEAEPTVKVIIRLRDAIGAVLDQATVDVDLTSTRADDVLAVPVTALLSLEGGRFAVEVREGTSRRVVPVRTGISSDSMIEIAGAGLRPGMRVSNAGV